MKKKIIFLHHKDLHNNGPHAMYLLMTLSAAFLIAMGMLVAILIILKTILNI